MLNSDNSFFPGPLGAKKKISFPTGSVFPVSHNNLVNKAQFNILIQPNPSESVFHVK